MNADEEIAPAIQSILDATATRPPPQNHITVTPRSLPDALTTAANDGRIPVIAEYKPTSPTTPTETTTDPVDAATAMVDGGAAAISVLTEPDHFGGSPDALRQIRDAVSVPILRKDFILEEAHLDLVTADIVLLIARFVDDLEALIAAAHDRGFQVLVEVHTTTELRAAVDAGATIIGINNRDLTRLTVDLDTFEQVAPAAPDDITLLAESGITTPAAARRMQTAGADGLLIGTAITHGPDTITANTKRFTHA